MQGECSEGRIGAGGDWCKATGGTGEGGTCVREEGGEGNRRQGHWCLGGKGKGDWCGGGGGTR